jgi:hypothetical protein
MFSHNSGQHKSRTLAFEFEFAEIFVIENRLPVSVSRGVGSPGHQQRAEQILDPLMQRHHQRQNFFNNIFFQCLILDYMHVFARYSLKLTFRKY